MLARPRKITVRHDVPVWIITFGDMMALLLCFFILLQMFSELKKDKEYQRVVTAVREAFGYAGSVGVLPVDDPPLTSAIETLDAMAVRRDRAITDAQTEPRTEGRPADDGVSGPRTRVRSIRDGVVFTVGGAGTFDPWSADVGPALRDELEKLARLLAGRTNKIEIVGHAAAKHRPAGAAYRDLDELSYRRAEAVRDVLVSCGLDERAFRLTSAGAREPQQARAWSEDRAIENRRVDVIMTDVLIEDVADDALFTDDDGARGG